MRPIARHKTRVNALMTRDARLSALRRGDFGPGSALPFPAFPPDPCSEAPRGRVIVLGGRGPGPFETNGYEPQPRNATPALPTGPSPETPLDEQGCESIIIASFRRQSKYTSRVHSP